MTRRRIFALPPAAPVVTMTPLAVVVLVALFGGGLHAQTQVTSARLIDAAKEPQNWLTYSGGYFSQRYSALAQIDPANVKNLEQKWVYQGAVAGSWQTSPLVVDGVMYITQRPNDVLALDAKTGRAFWASDTAAAARRASINNCSRVRSCGGYWQWKTDAISPPLLQAYFVASHTP